MVTICLHFSDDTGLFEFLKNKVTITVDGFDLELSSVEFLGEGGHLTGESRLTFSEIQAKE